MGKQSARLFYEGEDCYDVYYDGSNLSKMYKNGDILWERLPPKFILSGGNRFLYTSEKMKAISSFREPFLTTLGLKTTEELETHSINGIEYIDGYYYILYIFGIIEYRERKTRRWLLKSENGYDWEKVLDFEEEKTYVLDMKKYKDKLIFATESFDGQAFEGLFTMDSNLRKEQIFNSIGFPHGLLHDRHIIVGDDTIIWDGFVIKNNSYIGTVQEGEIGSFVYERKNKYFYKRQTAENSNLRNIFRSKDGINWTRYFVIPSDYALDKMLFSDGYIYLTDTKGTVYKTKDGTNIEKKENIIAENLYGSISYFCVNDYFYFSFDKTKEGMRNYGVYRTKDFFKVQETSDGFTNAEKVKMAYFTLEELGHACCTDDNVAIYI